MVRPLGTVRQDVPLLTKEKRPERVYSPGVRVRVLQDSGLSQSQPNPSVCVTDPMLHAEWWGVGWGGGVCGVCWSRSNSSESFIQLLGSTAPTTANHYKAARRQKTGTGRRNDHDLVLKTTAS
jgi:hypothetical protein